MFASPFSPPLHTPRQKPGMKDCLVGWPNMMEAAGEQAAVVKIPHIEPGRTVGGAPCWRSWVGVGLLLKGGHGGISGKILLMSLKGKLNYGECRSGVDLKVRK